MNIDQFPSLHGKTEKSFVSVANAVKDIANGVEDGEIRNVILKEAKSTLSSAVSDAWSKQMNAQIPVGGIYLLDQSIQDLYWDVRVHGLHDIISASKKLQKTKIVGPLADAMRVLAAELLPLALAVSSLKDKVVMGRAPSSGPSKPINPNKIVKTCPCCFRAIAIGLDGKMVHHGFERPGIGYQTASCPGIKFLSLEVSTDGLVYIIGRYEVDLADSEQRLAKKDQLTGLATRNRKGQVTEIKRGEPGFDRELRIWAANLENQITYFSRDLKTLKQRLAEWIPQPF